ncbi:MAG: YbaB/EbfC family nucleoid-associated protein [Methylotenera sp.]|jgi:nucleoid-associated protein EbfC|nr:YbaB/EbfC family nucleoid-associated protein [Methylotenera sp.]HOY86994.1 YbaB/EbfC family nucleoid-associated protein [Methylotenera sp.]HPH08337.1 YbaB/EbfC family nucleoid-associated protein [Methylotenera sp.]HPM48742.1 YbaB/EbfC family nucleoid-associated protein [Methylotenera sp.]HPV33048.1 YbaB/EbfC family nucleoid-associated protein [Methylotenera sp.]
MMKGGMGNMLKQAQMMQANMQKVQDQLAATEVEGIASNGMVKVTMTCNNTVKRVVIADDAMDDKETLEDLILIALTDAKAKAEATSQQHMAGVVPAGFKMPF